MEYQKLINLLDNTTNQPTKLTTKNWVEIELWEAYKKDDQITFKILILGSTLFDYSDAYKLFKGTIKVENRASRDQPNNAANRNIIFKHCTPFTNSINNTQNKQYASRWYSW